MQHKVWWNASGWTLVVSCILLAAVEAPGSQPASPSPSSETVPAVEKGLQFQEFDDPTVPLAPARKRTAADEARINALSWFGVGRIRQARNDFRGALAAYERAVVSDPTAITVYRVLIPLAVEQKRIDDAVKWAIKAVELDPSDQQFLAQAEALLVGRNDLAEAVRLLEQALQSPEIDRRSTYFVVLNRELAVLCSFLNRKEQALAGYEVVFDAVVEPEKYKLDQRFRRQLLDNQATTFERMGQVFLEGRKYDLALVAFQKSAEDKKGPAAVNLAFNLAQVHLQAGHPELALEELQKYINMQRTSKGRAAYELLAEILKKLDKGDELLPRLEAAAAKDARNSHLQYFLADQYAAHDRLEQAEQLYKKTLEESSEPAGFVGLAGVYRRQNRPADLLEILRRGSAETGEIKVFDAEFKAIAADEKLLDALLAAGDKLLSADPPELDFAAGYVLANVAADGKRVALSEKFYRHILPLRPERAEKILEELGGIFMEAHQYADAIKVFREAVDDAALVNARPNFLFHLTQALALSGDITGARATIAQALELLPDNPLLRFQEAWVYYHGHDYDEAAARFEKLIADFPQPPPQVRPIIRRAQYSLSNIHVLQGEIRKGEEILEAIFKADPDDTSVNNDLGYLYADQGKNLEQAEQMIKKALASDPDNGAYLDSMGWVLFKLGKAAEALPFIEQAIKKSTGTGDETLWEHLGDIHDKLQQSAKALEAWKKSLELGEKAAFPDQKLIERIKDKIKGQGSG